MIRRLLTVTTLFLVMLAWSVAWAQTKIDPYLDRPRAAVTGKAMSLAGMPESDHTAVHLTSVFIETSDVEATRRRVEEAGGSVQTAVGDILIASVELDSLDDIAQGDEVIFIEGAKPIRLSNDVASMEINSYEVHDGVNLPQGYTGSGVIVGVLDTGIDYDHPDFFDSQGRSRVLAIWDQNRSGGPGPSEIGAAFGTECDRDSIEDGSCSLIDTDGHGTHVAGIVAGRNEKYRGVAPDANIIVVSYDSSLDLSSGYADAIFSTNICQAAYYVFAKAAVLGRPAVVNLSLGTHIGPHDGTSLFEKCLSGLLADSSGRAIVAAAGNEYSNSNNYTGIHTGFEVDGAAMATNFVIRRLSEDRVYYIDLWGARGSELKVGLALHVGMPSGAPHDFSGMVRSGARSSGSFLGGDIEYSINASETQSVLNGKPHVGIRILLDKEIDEPQDYSFDLVVEGNGSFDAWLFPDKPSRTVQFTAVSGDRGADWIYVPGDREKSIAVPATSADVIAVAGYTTRNHWDGGPGCCEVSYTLNELLSFSSSGPSADPEATGFKPEIAAPGGMIASALSSYASPNEVLVLDDGLHVLQAGTSMAAPFVSGTIALMFSADPNFTHQDVRQYLMEGAYADGDIGEVPHLRWGYGKLDVLAAVQIAVTGGASGSFDANGSLGRPPAHESHASCQLIEAPVQLGYAMVMLALLTITVALIVLLPRLNRARTKICK